MPTTPTWLLYALGAAVAASLINIFAKFGMKDVDKDLATAVRSVVQALFVVGFALVIGVAKNLGQLVGANGGKAIASIVLTGVCGGLSWIFAFRAIQLADVSKVAPIDKLSMPLGIILAVVLLGERPTGINWLGIALITGGAYLAAMKG